MRNILPNNMNVVTEVLCNELGGCLRRTAATPPIPTEATPTTTSPTHREICTATEQRAAACVNGECQAVFLQGTRVPFCSCFEEWGGKRCQEQQIPLDWLEVKSLDQMRTAGLAAGVSIAILIVFIALVAIFVYMRKCKKSRQPRLNCGEDDETPKVEIGSNGVDPSNLNLTDKNENDKVTVVDVVTCINGKYPVKEVKCSALRSWLLY